jgi:salicylate synthetase
MTAADFVLRVSTILENEDFFVWTTDEETTVAIGARLRAKVEKDTVVVTGRDPIATSQPFAVLPEVLARWAPGPWRAYGYIAFDASSYAYSYRKRRNCAAVEIILPDAVLTLRGTHVEIEANEELRARLEDALATGRAHDACPDPGLRQAVIETGRDRYEAAFRAALDRIRAKRLMKVILSRHISVDGRLDVLRTYANASETRAARRFAFRLGNVRGVGACPELLLTVDSHGHVMTNPLAGTRPRGATAQEDAQLRRELLSDPKELSEHAMSILCAYEELAPICSRETLRVEDFMRVKAYPFTQHLSSRAVGTLAPDRTSWDALRAVFPGVTCSGVEKAAAIALIDELEDGARGVYGGAVGWIAHDGAMDWGIALRSVFDYGDEVVVSAGAGIVEDSNFDYEFHESANKLRTIGSRIAIL